MGDRKRFKQWKFWALALLWLPAGVAATAAVRFAGEPVSAVEPGVWPTAFLMAVGSLVPVAPCGLPLALACRRLWRLGYSRAAWMTGAALGALTAVASLFAGLLGPLAIAVCALLLSLPVWVAAVLLGRRG